MMLTVFVSKGKERENVASNKFLEETGLSRLWAHTKQYVNDTFSHGFGGGENLFKNSENTFNLSVSGNPSVTTREQGKITFLTAGSGGGYAWVESFVTGDLKAITANVGDEFTISVDVRTTNLKDDKVFFGGYFRYPSSSVNRFPNVFLDKNKNGQWYRISTTIKLTLSGWSNMLLEFHNDETGTEDNTGLIIEYKNFKFERGAIATPWSLAPSEQIIVTRDFQCLNGTNNGTSGNTSDITFLNFPTYQMMFFNTWINNINATTAWQRKDVVSIPKKYFRFSKIANLTSYAPTWVIDGNKALDIALDLETGIINVSPRTNVPVDNASVQFYAIFTN